MAERVERRRRRQLRVERRLRRATAAAAGGVAEDDVSSAGSTDTYLLGEYYGFGPAPLHGGRGGNKTTRRDGVCGGDRVRGARQALGMEPPAGPVESGGGAEPNAAVQAPANAATVAGASGQEAGEGDLIPASDTHPHHHPGRLTTELGKPDPAANREAAAAVHGGVPPPPRRPAPRPPVPDCFLCPLTLEVGVLDPSPTTSHMCDITPPMRHTLCLPVSDCCLVSFFPLTLYRGVAPCNSLTVSFHSFGIPLRNQIMSHRTSLCAFSGLSEPGCCR